MAKRKQTWERAARKRKAQRARKAQEKKKVVARSAPAETTSRTAEPAQE